MANISHDAKAVVFANGQFGSKIENAKEVRNAIVRPH